MTKLSIDVETYSSVDLRKSGVYKYTEAEDFEILLLAYSWDGGEVEVIDLTQDEMPADVLFALDNPEIIKTAWNANFERTCLSAHFGVQLGVDDWEDTMVKAAYSGLPLSLDMCSKILNVDQKKDAAGKALIKYFTRPCAPTKINGGRTRNYPHHDEVKWSKFMDYCAQDVRTELSIAERLSNVVIPESEKKLWVLDQNINDRGILVDRAVVEGAISINEEVTQALTHRAAEITGLANPNSLVQLKAWMSSQSGEEVTSLTKKDFEGLKEAYSDLPDVVELIELRSELGKSSITKYAAIESCVCKDNRVRGLFQFYGANRTGRWAGRLVQMQNLRQNHLTNLDLARELVKAKDTESISLLFPSVPDTLSQLVRTSFIAPEGHTLLVADFSAIEARVIAWLAGEAWRLDVFNTHGKIYEASAAKMFNIPIDQITKGSDYRQKGKVAELALGYQGGPGALAAMGALNMGLSEQELPGLVRSWRRANPNIVKFWGDLEDAAVCALTDRTAEKIRGLTVSVDGKCMTILLPSGRKLYYQDARFESGFGNDKIMYNGVNQMAKRWETSETYGGKLTENVVQAIARDCLADAMLRLDAAGLKIIMSVHDEVVIEVPADESADRLHQVNEIMSQEIKWAVGLPLKADSYLTYYYKKD